MIARRGRLRAVSGCYLFFHYEVGNIRFLGQGWARPVYFAILISHVTLAIVIVPLAIITLSRGLKARYAQASRHRALDLAAVDVCFGHRRDRVFHAVPVVPA